MKVALANLRRLGHIARVAARHGMAVLFARARPGRPATDHVVPSARPTQRPAASRLLWRLFSPVVGSLPGHELTGPERLRLALEELGGTFIKLGQMLALQPDILSLEYCNALFKLLDRVEPFPYAEVERTFVEELGETPDELFDRFERESFAAASIGQVHRAVLGERRLAVKVRRPSVETDFAGDIRLMAGCVRLIKTLRIERLHWLVEPLSEFIGWTREELDYRNEARYMERLRRNAEGNPKERIPAVLWELSGPRILVLDYLDGPPVVDYVRALETGDELTPRRLETEGFDADAFARAIIDNFLGDAFRHGLFHADLHPANLLILPGSVVGYIDFGITGVLSTYSRRHLIAMTLAYTRGDLDGMTEAFFKVSAMDPGSDPEAFRAGLARLGESWYDVRGRGGRRLRKNFTLVMLDMLRLSRATGIWPERDVIKYIRSAIAIDGLIGRFAPGFDVGRYLERVCARHLRLQGLQAAVSEEQVLDWSVASARLARTGALRGGSLLDRVLRGDLPVRAELVRGGRKEGAGLRARAYRQAAAVAGLALLLGATAPQSTGIGTGLGLNLFTAQAALVLAAVIQLGRTAWELV